MLCTFNIVIILMSICLILFYNSLRLHYKTNGHIMSSEHTNNQKGNQIYTWNTMKLLFRNIEIITHHSLYLNQQRNNKL